MEQIVRVLAPRSLTDAILKVSVFLLFVVADSLLIHLLFERAWPEDLMTFVIKTMLVAVPFTVLVFAALHHQNALQQKLHRMATRDALTGLRNYGAFFIDARALVAREHDCTLILLDGDYFKSINDTYGHMTGDAALVAIAERITSVETKGDISGRLGGEEFALLIRGADHGRIMGIAEQLIAPISIQHGNHRFEITLSAGIARNLGQPLETTFGEADCALYGAKANGRACFSHYDDKITGVQALPPPVRIAHAVRQRAYR